jgi:hypothetical protein
MRPYPAGAALKAAPDAPTVSDEADALLRKLERQIG